MLMEGKTGFIAGVANHRSIAWSIARALDREGAKLALGYLSDRKTGIEKIVGQLSNPPLLIQCDASDDESVHRAFDQVSNAFERIDSLVHAIAFAKRKTWTGATSILLETASILHSTSARSPSTAWCGQPSR